MHSEFPHADKFEFSCINVLECTNNILTQAAKYSSYNVIVSPMNNKISTVACAFAAFKNEEIQLAIAIPAVYNVENYSSASDLFFLIDSQDFFKKG